MTLTTFIDTVGERKPGQYQQALTVTINPWGTEFTITYPGAILPGNYTLSPARARQLAKTILAAYSQPRK